MGDTPHGTRPARPPAPTVHTLEPPVHLSLGPAPPPSPAAPTLAPRVPGTLCLALLMGPHLPNLLESAGPTKNPLVPGLAPQPTRFSFLSNQIQTSGKKGRKRKPHSASPKVLANFTGHRASSQRVWKHGEAPSPGNHPTQCAACSLACLLSSTIKPLRGHQMEGGGTRPSSRLKHCPCCLLSQSYGLS